MRKASRLVAVLAVIALVGTTAALAYGPALSYAQRYNEVKNLRIYDRNYLLRPDEGTGLVQMPIPSNTETSPSLAEMQSVHSENAANLTSPEDVSRLGASVLPGKGGMAMMTTRERTQNEVRRISRALD